MNQVAVKPVVIFIAFPGYCSTFVQRLQMCVGKCGVVERDLCAGQNGELFT